MHTLCDSIRTDAPTKFFKPTCSREKNMKKKKKNIVQIWPMFSEPHSIGMVHVNRGEA